MMASLPIPAQFWEPFREQSLIQEPRQMAAARDDGLRGGRAAGWLTVSWLLADLFPADVPQAFWK